MRRCAVSDVSRSEGSQRSMRTGVGEVPKSGNLPGKNMDGTSEEPVVLLVPMEVLSRKFNKLIIANHVIGAAYTSNFQSPPFVSLFLFLVHSLLFMAIFIFIVFVCSNVRRRDIIWNYVCWFCR